MDGHCTDGSCGNPPVLSGGSNDDCCDGAHPAILGARCANGHIESGGATGSKRTRKRELEDGAISALLELNNFGTDHTTTAAVMVGGNRKHGASPHRRSSPAHCDGSGFSPVHGGHGNGEVLSAFARAPGSPSPVAGGRMPKVKRQSDGSVDAAAAIAAAGGLSALLGPITGLQLPLCGPTIGPAGQMSQAAMQQQYMQQYMQQQYMSGPFGYQWMPMMMPAGAAMMPSAVPAASNVPSPVPAAPAVAQPTPAAAASPAATPAQAAAKHTPKNTAAASPATNAAAAATATVQVVDPLPRCSVEKWGVQQVVDWMRTIHCEDLVATVTSQEIDGMALKAMYRTGSSGMDALHGLLRSEFPSSKTGHRLRLVEGLVSLFALPSPAA